MEISVTTDRSTLKPRLENVAGLIQWAGISPTGKRALFYARGDVFSAPAEHGVVRNLTRSSGVAERYPAWSPDGKLIAYWSDRSGEYELTVREAERSPEGDDTERTLTKLGPGFRYTPQWSPDSKKILWIDQAMKMWVYDFDTQTNRFLDRQKWIPRRTRGLPRQLVGRQPLDCLRGRSRQPEPGRWCYATSRTTRAIR